MQDIAFADNFNDYLFEDAETLLNPQEIKEIDDQVYHVIYAVGVAQKIFKTKGIAKGRREYDYSIAQETSAPKFSQDFLPEAIDKVTKKEETVKLIGISKDYFISMVDIDASRNSTYHREPIDALHLREITALVADYKERVLWRGYDILGADPGVLDTSAYGFVTKSGIGTFGAGIGADASIKDAGDGPASLGAIASDLITAKHPAPYVAVFTPMVYARFMVNMNSTTHMTDIERMQSMVDKDGNKLFSGFFVTPHLLNAAETDGTGSILGIALKTNAGEPTAFVVESYPLWHYPITINKLGIQGKVLWMGSAVVLRADAFTLETTITLTT